MMSKKNKQQKENEELLDPAVEETTEGMMEEAQEALAASQAELTAAKQENDELRDKFLRLYAEFDNYKKRTLKEKMELMKTASQDIIVALLPVLDDFDRAKKNAEDESNAEVFSDGVRLVYQKLYNVLKARGLEPMETNGEVFDPELHEAVTEIPAPSEEMKGHIIDTIEKGYKLNDKIIRHAKVVVGK